MDPPAVSPELYDTDYFLSAAAGHAVWARSGGRELDGRYRGTIELAQLRPGETLVDLGCGRGELLVAAFAAGASRAIGVEYSADAVALARRTVEAHHVSAEILHADLRAVPLPDHEADLVCLLDVVEHLNHVELGAALAEARRLLRPGGRIVVHTLPNRLIYDVTYRLQRLVHPTWPRQPRNDHELALHVGEQTPGSLRRALQRAGFEHVRVNTGEWIHDEFVPRARSRRTYRRLARNRLTSRFGAADIWGFAQSP